MTIQVQWRSFELRPKDAPPLPPDYLERIQAARPRLYAVAREQYGLELNPGPFGFDSRPALIGAKVAEAAGVGAAYQRAVMHAYWQEAADIADPAVLGAIAQAIGLDSADFLAALDDPAYIAQVDQDIAQARAYGLDGVPAMVLKGQYLVSGAQPLPVLQQVLGEILSNQ